MAPPQGPRRGGGIQKRQRAGRDHDGDILMGATPKVTIKATKKQHGSNLTDLRVTGWSEIGDTTRVANFLERHAAKRCTSEIKGAKIIKRQRVTGQTLIISIRPEHVNAFGKINGFSFTSTKGKAEILKITGQGIRATATTKSPEPTDPAAAVVTGESANETIQLFKNLLAQRYNPDTKTLDLSNLANAEGMYDLFHTSTATRSKFMPVLMKVIEDQLPSADAKRQTIEGVNLSNNDLENIDWVSDLARGLPHLRSLDLSNNKFKSTRELGFWKHKFRTLQILVLSNNPLETSQTGWENDVIAWYPRLRFLNGHEVRTAEQIARIEGPKETPRPSAQNVWMDDGNIGQNFLLEFLPGFDADRTAILQKFYDNTSVFSLSVNARARGGAGNQHDKTPWDSYLPQSRNLKHIHSKRTRFTRKHTGVDQIATAWNEIPPTRHPQLGSSKYIMDCQSQPGIPDPTGQYPQGINGLILTVHGEYEEHRTAKGADEVVRRAFDRTITLGPGGASGVRVVSDFLCLRAAGGVPAWNLTPGEEAKVTEVRQATNLTQDMAIQCLKAGNWDMAAASEIFIAQKDNLPPDAFEPFEPKV